MTFQEAISHSSGYSKKHLLLGNGFSIACVPTIFSYNSLYSAADLTAMPELAGVFSSLKTNDFELVINTLENSSKILTAYDSNLDMVSNKMHQQAQALKEKLIQTVADNHPAIPGEIQDSKYEACLKFLANFIDQKGNIYTLNYDLLLYWTLMYGWNKKLINTQPNDGFGRDSAFYDGQHYVDDYLTWQGDKNAHGQNVHYLHGALHIYDRGIEVEKFNWTDTHKPLIDQAREALSQDRFPLFVAEGESEKKLDRITHSGYLFHSYKSFSTTMSFGARSDKCCLFTFGVSFGANDAHILEKIANGKVSCLYVSLYGDPSTTVNKQIIKSAEELKRRRKDGNLDICYYIASTAHVWD